MTSAQLILVSVSSALIAVIAMLVVATVLRARTREGRGSEVSQATGPQTRAQRAAARAQRKAQRAAMKAERKSDKAAASVAKTEKRKAAAKTEPTDEKTALGTAAEAPAQTTDNEDDPKSLQSKDTKEDASEDDAPRGKGLGDKAESQSASVAAESSTTPDKTDELDVPDTRGRLGGTAGPKRSDEKADEVATTEAGKRAAVAKPRARRSLLGRDQAADDSPENKG